MSGQNIVFVNVGNKVPSIRILEMVVMVYGSNKWYENSNLYKGGHVNIFLGLHKRKILIVINFEIHSPDWSVGSRLGHVTPVWRADWSHTLGLQVSDWLHASYDCHTQPCPLYAPQTATEVSRHIQPRLRWKKRLMKGDSWHVLETHPRSALVDNSEL